MLNYDNKRSLHSAKDLSRKSEIETKKGNAKVINLNKVEK